ncbi:MAG: hypothetical protein ACK55I_42890, partial [bacterium]
GIKGQRQIQALPRVGQFAVPRQRRTKQHVALRHGLRSLHRVQRGLSGRLKLHGACLRIAWQIAQQRTRQAEQREHR